LQFHKILENVFYLSPDPNIIVDESGNIIKANAIGQELFNLDEGSKKILPIFLLLTVKGSLMQN
jgi:PAS domain-containing protein